MLINSKAFSKKSFLSVSMILNIQRFLLNLWKTLYKAAYHKNLDKGETVLSSLKIDCHLDKRHLPSKIADKS